MAAKYIHDCNQCRYLGTGTALILGDGLFDFYICSDSTEHRIYRTCIARYGDVDSEYVSGVLFQCEELTGLDKVFLYNGLELTEAEEKKALRILIQMYKSKLGVSDYEYLSAGSNCSFGLGNVFWKDTI